MKINNKLSPILMSALLLMSASACASPYVIGQAGIYGMGANNYFNNLYDNEVRMTGRFGLGYLWDLNEIVKLGVEAGLHLNQAYKDGDSDFNMKVERHSLDALAVLDIHFNNPFDVFAKVGLSRISDKLSVNFSNTSFSISDHAVVPKVVLGAGYDLSSNVNVHVALTHEFKRNNEDYIYGVEPSASSLMLGMMYRFA